MTSDSRESIKYILGFLEQSSDAFIDKLDKMSSAEMTYLDSLMAVFPLVKKDFYSKTPIDTWVKKYNLSSFNEKALNQIFILKLGQNGLESLNESIVKIIKVLKENNIKLSFVKEMISDQVNLRKSISKSLQSLSDSFKNAAFGLNKTEMELLSRVNPSTLKKMNNVDPIDLKLLTENFDLYLN